MVHLNKPTPDTVEGADTVKIYKIPPNKMARPC